MGKLWVTCLTSVSWPWISLSSFCVISLTIAISFCKSIFCCFFLVLYCYVCSAHQNFLNGVLSFHLPSFYSCKGNAFSVSAFWMFSSWWILYMVVVPLEVSMFLSCWMLLMSGGITFNICLLVNATWWVGAMSIIFFLSFFASFVCSSGWVVVFSYKCHANVMQMQFMFFGWNFTLELFTLLFQIFLYVAFAAFSSFMWFLTAMSVLSSAITHAFMFLLITNLKRCSLNS